MVPEDRVALLVPVAPLVPLGRAVLLDRWVQWPRARQRRQRRQRLLRPRRRQEGLLDLVDPLDPEHLYRL